MSQDDTMQYSAEEGPSEGMGCDRLPKRARTKVSKSKERFAVTAVSEPVYRSQGNTTEPFAHECTFLHSYLLRSALKGEDEANPVPAGLPKFHFRKMMWRGTEAKGWTCKVKSRAQFRAVGRWVKELCRRHDCAFADERGPWIETTAQVRVDVFGDEEGVYYQVWFLQVWFLVVQCTCM